MKYSLTVIIRYIFILYNMKILSHLNIVHILLLRYVIYFYIACSSEILAKLVLQNRVD